MLYKFKSKSGSDVIMMGPNGDEVLRLIGKQPAPQGIIEPAGGPSRGGGGPRRPRGSRPRPPPAPKARSSLRAKRSRCANAPGPWST